MSPFANLRDSNSSLLNRYVVPAFLAGSMPALAHAFTVRMSFFRPSANCSAVMIGMASVIARGALHDIGQNHGLTGLRYQDYNSQES